MKILHIFTIVQPIFIIPLIETMEKHFSSNIEHAFVVRDKALYDNLSGHGNIYLEELGKKQVYEIINEYGDNFSFIICHGLNTFDIPKIDKRLRKKIIWRTWGYDQGVSFSKNPFISIYRNTFSKFLFRRNVSQICAIGVANSVDVIKLSSFGIKKKFFRLGYGREDIPKIIDSLEPQKKNDSQVKILIGHSGFYSDHHIKLIKLIQKFTTENIKVYLPLAYGVDEYIEKVKTFAVNVLGDKVCFIDNKLPLNDYVKFLSTVDIALFDMETSNALGNFGILLYMRKTIYINDKSDIKKAFDYEGVPYKTTSMINKMDFSDFSKPLVYSLSENCSLKSRSYNIVIDDWADFFNYLTSISDDSQL